MGAGPARRGRQRLLVKMTALLVVLLAALPAAAAAAGPEAKAERSAPPPVTTTTSTPAGTPVPSDLPPRPADFTIDGERALRIADADPNVVAKRDQYGTLTAGLEVKPGEWEVSYFAAGNKVVLVVVDGNSGAITESWTGEQVAWPMARGHSGQFGHLLNAPYVWIPLALIFFFGLFDFRRPTRIVHLDLAVLLSFGISQAFFNAAEIGVSVPLYYPPLLYLLGRMLWIGFRGSTPVLKPSLTRSGLKWAVVLCVVLAVFRVTINVADSGVIDVGYAGVIGADQITDAEPIYGEGVFPANNPTGDTYGPANYFAYVPFEQVFPWSGDWDELPAAHAAALFFDLLTLAGLIVLGRRLAGNRLAVTLALAWLAYPYADFVLQSNSNDSLLAALLIWTFVLLSRPLARGALLALAFTAKFAPLVVAPMLLVGERGLAAYGGSGSGARWRQLGLAVAAFVVVSALLLAHPLIDPGLSVFWERTLKSQLDRVSPFSIWGQAELEPLQTLCKLGTAALAALTVFVPRRRHPGRLAALAAAVTIAVEICAEHWFYLYIVWFLPALLIAIAWRPGPRERQAAASAAT